MKRDINELSGICLVANININTSSESFLFIRVRTEEVLHSRQMLHASSHVHISVLASYWTCFRHPDSGFRSHHCSMFCVYGDPSVGSVSRTDPGIHGRNWRLVTPKVCVFELLEVGQVLVG